MTVNYDDLIEAKRAWFESNAASGSVPYPDPQPNDPTRGIEPWQMWKVAVAVGVAQRHIVRQHPPEWRPWEDPQYRTSVTHFACWDSERQRSMPLKIAGESWAGSFSAGAVPWDTLAWGIARVRVAR